MDYMELARCRYSCKKFGSRLSLVCIVLCVLTACAQTPSNDIVAAGESPVRVSDSYSFTEGPAADAKGDVFFTDQPNGLVGTPDGKHLYVAEAKANRILKYDIQPDGSLTNRQVFADMGSDGMTIDDRGNIYLTGDGVTVFNKDGQKIAHFPIPEDWTANVCFGGKERNILFITASKSVYTLKMLVHGVSNPNGI